MYCSDSSFCVSSPLKVVWVVIFLHISLVSFDDQYTFEQTNKTTFTILYLISHKLNNLHFELIWSWCVGLDIKCRSVRVWMEVCSDMRSHLLRDTLHVLRSAAWHETQSNTSECYDYQLHCKKNTPLLFHGSCLTSAVQVREGGVHTERTPPPLQITDDCCFAQCAKKGANHGDMTVELSRNHRTSTAHRAMARRI